jgi:hypothetical protein
MTAEVKDEVKRLKAERKREREEVRHARSSGGAQAEEWRQKMEEHQEEQSKKLDSLNTLLRQYISSQMSNMSSRTSIESGRPFQNLCRRRQQRREKVAVDHPHQNCRAPKGLV